MSPSFFSTLGYFQYLVYKGNHVITAIYGKIPGYWSEDGHLWNSKHCWHAFLPFRLFLSQAAPGWGISPLHLHHLMYSAEFEFSHYSEEREANLQPTKSTQL